MSWLTLTTDRQVSTGGTLKQVTYRALSHTDTDNVCHALCKANNRSFSQLCSYASSDSKSSEVKQEGKRFTVCVLTSSFTPVAYCSLWFVFVATHWDTHTLNMHAHTQTHSGSIMAVWAEIAHQRQAKKVRITSHTEHQHLLHKSSPSTETTPQHSLTESMSNSAWERKWV